MAFDPVKNFSYGTILTAPSPASSGTSFVLNSGQGALFPAPATEGSFNVVIWPVSSMPTSTNAEIVRVTAISTDTFTITRQQEGTSARTVVVGDQVALVPTAKTMNDIFDNLGSPNLLQNSNFINNSTNGYGSTPDDWTSSSANPVQGGFPAMTKQNLIDLLGVADGDIEGLWPLNESSGNALDLSSNAYNLTDNNTVTSSNDGLMGKARSFASASTEYFSIADASAPNLEISGSQTFFAYINAPSETPEGSIMGKNSASAHDIYITSGIPHFRLSGLTTNTDIGADVTLTSAKWNMIVGVYDSANTKLKIWVNGIKKEVTASGSSTDTNAIFAIGAASAGTNLYDGLIQYAGVLSVALSDSQVKKLFAATLYRGQKVRRATTNASLTATLAEDKVERLRGKVVTMSAKMWQDTASTGTISINDGAEVSSSTTTTTGSWVNVSVTDTISSTATSITLALECSTSDGNVWFKDVMLNEGYGKLPWISAHEDWILFPRLLRMEIPAVISAYQFEENRIYTYAPTYTGFSSAPTGTHAWSITGNMVYINVELSGYGTSNATGFTMTLPILSSSTTGQTPGGRFAARDNGTNYDSPAVGNIAASTKVLNLYRLNATQTWTNANGKGAYMGFSYLID